MYSRWRIVACPDANAPDVGDALGREAAAPPGVIGVLTELGETVLQRPSVHAPHLDAESWERGQHEIGHPLRFLVAGRPGVHLEPSARAKPDGNPGKERAHEVEAILSAMGMKEVSGIRRNQLERRIDQHEVEAILGREGLEQASAPCLQRRVAALGRQVDCGIRRSERERPLVHIDADDPRSAAARRGECIHARTEAQLQNLVAVPHVHRAHHEHLLEA